jgi:hypothetical protein
MDPQYFWEEPLGETNKPRYVHKIASIKPSYTPADSEAEEYTAVCGCEGQSWGMPSQNIVASFTAEDLSGFPAGAKLCSGCFPKKE